MAVIIPIENLRNRRHLVTSPQGNSPAGVGLREGRPPPPKLATGMRARCWGRSRLIDAGTTDAGIPVKRR
jgi:hypothetical protein